MALTYRPTRPSLHISRHGRESREKLIVSFVAANMELDKDPTRNIEVVLMYEGVPPCAGMLPTANASSVYGIRINLCMRFCKQPGDKALCY